MKTFFLSQLVYSILALSALGEELEFDPVRVVDPQPALKDPVFIKRSEVKDEVLAGELVIGVAINNQARAYPINMLTGPQREIINDFLGGKAIAATW